MTEKTIQNVRTIILNINLDGPHSHRLQARLEGVTLVFEVIDRDKVATPISCQEAQILLEMRRAVVK